MAEENAQWLEANTNPSKKFGPQDPLDVLLVSELLDSPNSFE